MGQRCKRCIIRDLPCSYVTLPGASTRASTLTSNSLWPRSPTAPDDPLQYSRRAASPPVNTASEVGTSIFDIGGGTPSEVLREGELRQDLLLLYFSNFGDIHFMFDKSSFIRQVALGEIPKTVLYAMMALSVKYSNSPVFGRVSRSHRGESLFQEARKFLAMEFDDASLTSIQVYVLLSTYCLSFGSARKAWLYLGVASSICKMLRLAEDRWESEPLRREMCRRLLSTVVLMDRLISPALDFSPYFTLGEIFNHPCSEVELRRLKGRQPMAPQELLPANISDELLKLSKTLCQVCLYHRQGSNLEELQYLERQQDEWISSSHPSLAYNSINFERHRAEGTLREFIYLNLLYHHVCQLVYFPSLEGRGTDVGPEPNRPRILKCYQHANQIVEITQNTWKIAGFDIQNINFGQILTVSAAVHMHACLFAESKEQRQFSQAHVSVITDCMFRVREYCRVFFHISAQLSKFLRSCSQSSPTYNIFDNNGFVIRQVLFCSTAYDRLNCQNDENLEGNETLSNLEDVEYTSNLEGVEYPSNPSSTSNVLDTTLASVISPEYLEWLASQES